MNVYCYALNNGNFLVNIDNFGYEITADGNSQPVAGWSLCRAMMTPRSRVNAVPISVAEAVLDIVGASQAA